jgi:hypothetical protein
MSGARWLLDWTLGGRVYRFATDAATVSDDDGTQHVYSSGLNIRSVSRLASAATIEIMGGPVWADLVWAGIQLERGAMLLRYHRDGHTLEQSEVWLSGIGVGAEYGDAFEPLSIRLDGNPALLARKAPPESTIVSTATWPVYVGATQTEQSHGSYPPVVFGYPGLDTGSPAYRIYPTELISAAADRSVVALGEIKANTIDVTCVNPSTQSADYTATMTVSTLDDKLGQLVSYVVPSGTWNGSTTTFTDDGELWASHTTAAGGGIERNGVVVRGLADVASYLLKTYSDIQIDNARWAMWADYHNVIKIDTAIEEPINVWEYVQRALLPLTESVPRWSDKGLWLMPLRWDAALADSVGHLEVGRNCERAGRLRNRDPVSNRFTIRYRRSVRGFRATREIAGEPGKMGHTLNVGLASDPRVLTSFVVARSVAEWGEVPHPALDTACLWSESSAQRVLQLKALRHAWPKRTLQLQGGSELERYEPGDVVTVTDTALNITSVLAIVENKQQTTASAALNVTLLDGPAR